MTDLKANFERFFKTELKDKQSLNESKQSTKPKVEKLTDEQKTRFSNLSRKLAINYPNAFLTIKEGFVWMGAKKVEPANVFLNRSAAVIQEMVRSFSNSGKPGLL